MGRVELFVRDLTDDNPNTAWKPVTGTHLDDDEFALDVYIKGTSVPVEVTATEKTPINTKELKQLVDEDVPTATIEYAPLVMDISDPVTGTHYTPEQAFDIVYTSTGGKPARTCGLRISNNPIPDDAAYLLATPIQAEGGANAGTVPTIAPLAPGTYYIRGRVTDAQPLTALSNQVTIIVDAPVQRVVWFLAGVSSLA